jgi:hypothetical protein
MKSRFSGNAIRPTHRRPDRPCIVETRTTVAEAHVGRFEVLRWFGEVSRGGQAMAMNAERAA